jgi:hypothetical protein
MPGPTVIRIIRLMAGLSQQIAELADSDQPLPRNLLEALDELATVTTRLVQGDAVGARRASEQLDDITARTFGGAQ